MQQIEYCRNCGAVLPTGAHNCPRCHTAVNYDNMAYNKQTPPLNYGNTNGYNQQNQASQAWNNNEPFANGPEGKNRGTAAILALLIGGIGVHYFYLGKTAAGLITIVLSLVSCGIWSTLMFIQGIVMFCIDNQTFRNKYVANTTTLPLF